MLCITPAKIPSISQVGTQIVVSLDLKELIVTSTLKKRAFKQVVLPRKVVD